MNKLETLYDYFFHYNPYEKLWYAFKRGDHTKFFNGDKRGSMRNKDIDDLISDLLIKNKIHEKQD